MAFTRHTTYVKPPPVILSTIVVIIERSELNTFEKSLQVVTEQTVSVTMSEKSQREPGRSQPLPPIHPETMSMNIHLNMQHAAMQQTMRVMNMIREYLAIMHILLYHLSSSTD